MVVSDGESEVCCSAKPWDSVKDHKGDIGGLELS